VGARAPPVRYAARVRILSLLPAATEIVAALGLTDQLVGVSADSDWPPEVAGLPLVSQALLDTAGLASGAIDAAVAASAAAHAGRSLHHVDPELLRALRPELVLTQEVCAVCAVSTADVAAAAAPLEPAPRVLSLNASTLEQMLEDVESVGCAAGARDRATALVADLVERLNVVRLRAAPWERPRVLCLEWLDPPYSAGHWVPEMVEVAGGEERVGTPGGPSRRIAWEDVVAYRPQVLVLIPCSLPLAQVAAEFDLLRARPGWAELPAVRAGRVFAGETHLFSQPGPRLVDGVETLARLLHPEVFRVPLPPGQALALSADGQRLEPFR